MNTLCGNAVSPASHHRIFAIAAGKLGFAVAALVVLTLTFGVARAAGVNPNQPIRLDGKELFFGIVPAEILRGHLREYEEQTMHGGISRGKGAHHLIISVFDAKTRAGITDAMVTGSVAELGMAAQTRKPEAMSFGRALRNCCACAAPRRQQDGNGALPRAASHLAPPQNACARAEAAC